MSATPRLWPVPEAHGLYSSKHVLQNTFGFRNEQWKLQENQCPCPPARNNTLNGMECIIMILDQWDHGKILQAFTYSSIYSTRLWVLMRTVCLFFCSVQFPFSLNTTIDCCLKFLLISDLSSPASEECVLRYYQTGHPWLFPPNGHPVFRLISIFH